MDVVHQEFCPANLLVDPSNLEVKLIDFSISSTTAVITSNKKQTSFGDYALTYTSPEQTGRIMSEVDIRSNLYSLGIILYELLTVLVPKAASYLK